MAGTHACVEEVGCQGSKVLRKSWARAKVRERSVRDLDSRADEIGKAPKRISNEEKLQSLASMAKILSRNSSNLVSPCPHLCTSLPSKRSLAAVAFQPRFRSLNCSSKSSDFHGTKLVFQEVEMKSSWAKSGRVQVCEETPWPSTSSSMSLGIAKALRWWEKGLQPNMKEIQSTRDLVDSLVDAENKLVVVDFFSPGCGGCKALHPKISQIAEQNPDVQFLHVNYEEHKSMCYTLNVHVLPFFRFYRGAQGRVCSFSCTNATIKKFKDALAKHSTDRCSLGPARGLEDAELVALAANRDLAFKYTPKQPVPAALEQAATKERAPANPMEPLLPSSTKAPKEIERALVASRS
ncbi:hypothetical protein ACLOJK_025069 [Asimina triloba]